MPLNLRKWRFALIPKIPNSVYVVMIFSKMRAVIDAKMAKFTDIKRIITTKGIRVLNAIRLNFLSDNWQ